jgi:hypothetical protein
MMSQWDNPLPTSNFLFDIARGGVVGASVVNVFGFNVAVGTSFETLWNDGGNYVFPTEAKAMTAVSSSVLDTMQVLINGLDINYQPVTQIVTLTGTSPVSIPESIYRINSAVILSGSNVGNITIASGGVTYGYIGAGLGTTQACIYTVPEGHKLYLFRIDVNSATVTGSKYLTFRNVVQSPNGRMLRVAEATFATSQVSYDRQVPFMIDEKTDFLFEAKSSSGSNEVSIFVEAVLYKNPRVYG